MLGLREEHILDLGTAEHVELIHRQLERHVKGPQFVLEANLTPKLLNERPAMVDE